jgi:hypothetical protein
MSTRTYLYARTWRRTFHDGGRARDGYCTLNFNNCPNPARWSVLTTDAWTAGDPEPRPYWIAACDDCLPSNVERRENP